MWGKKKKNKKEVRKGSGTSARISGDIRELERQIEVSEREYEAVTSYLADMQRIERLPAAARHEVNDAARGIINLNRERKKYQNSSERLAGNRYRVMERYEKEIPDELRNIYEQEQRLEMINGDLRQLEGERAVIEYESGEAEQKKRFLKSLSISGGIMVVILFGALLATAVFTKASMTIPLLLTTVMAAVLIAYIARTMVRCDTVIKESVRKMQRLIQLKNKVKLKFVNCKNTLDYCYEKYEVESYRELSEVWEQYVKTRDEERRYRNSTEFLEQYSKQLIKVLSEAGVADPQIWVYQTEALLDDKEMVEVRHHLNIRRQKIRERLEACREELERCKNEKQEDGREYENWNGI